MKKTMLAAFAALVAAASVQAQSTVDSISAKYKLQPMPAALTMEQAFPVVGSYQLENSTEGAGTVTVNLDPTNKGMVWVDGLPQGKIKAYLKQSPATYRILSQKTESGKAVQEGTLHYDTTTHQLHIALGKSYNESDPTGIFAMAPEATTGMNASTPDETEMKVKNGDTKVKTEVKGNQVKTKSKTAAAGKEKTKVWFYTATKVMPEATMNNMQTQPSDSTHQ